MKYIVLILSSIILFQLNIYSKLTLQSYYDISLQKALDISQSDSDSAIFLLERIKQEKMASQDTATIIQCLLGMSSIQAKRLNHGDAFDHSGEALFLAEEYGDPLLLALSYSGYGRLNYVFNQKDAAGVYLQSACELYKDLFQQGKIKAGDLIYGYFDMARFNRWYNRFDIALVYLDSCYAISDTTAHNPVDRAYLDAEKGQILLKMGKTDEAIEVLIPTSLIFEDLENDTDMPSEDNGFLILLYSMLGDAYRELKENDLAMFFYEKSIKAGEEYKMHLGQKPYVLEQYAGILFEQGWYVEAYHNLKEAKRLNDRYFGARSFQNSDFITVKNRYRDELKKSKKELNEKNLVLTKKEKSVLKLRILFYTSAFLLLVVVSALLIRFQQQRSKKEKLEIVHKEEVSREDLEKKNKALVTRTLKLIEKEEIIVQLTKQLQKRGPEKETSTKFVKQSTKNLWEDFNKQFMDVNKGFYNRLQDKVPGLSPADQKICALMKLNFSGKEMALMLGISLGSVHMARHRLRKKMNMQREESLSAFIGSV